MQKFQIPHPYIRGLLDSPGTSYWLKDALRSSLNRDPVDAYFDAKTLLEAMRRRVDTILSPGEL